MEGRRESWQWDEPEQEGGEEAWLTERPRACFNTGQTTVLNANEGVVGGWKALALAFGRWMLKLPPSPPRTPTAGISQLCAQS